LVQTLGKISCSAISLIAIYYRKSSSINTITISECNSDVTIKTLTTVKAATATMLIVKTETLMPRRATTTE
jgi:hypothetical protein